MITSADKKKLLLLARETIARKLSGHDEIDVRGVENLSDERGVFVTLTKKGMLRGCIGNILPERPLYEAVIENSISSAFRDPRFQPLEDDELDEISISISILSVPVEVEYSSSDELQTKITPFEDGVILTFGRYRKSTFLPQVWEELPDFEEFMEHLSMKAGLNSDAWRKMSPRVEIYKADYFSEDNQL